MSSFQEMQDLNSMSPYSYLAAAEMIVKQLTLEETGDWDSGQSRLPPISKSLHPPNRCSRYKIEDDILLKALYPTVPAQEISELLGRTTESIFVRARKLELVKLPKYFKLNCANCNTEIKKWQSSMVLQIDNAKDYFCSMKCRKEFLNIDVTCFRCGKQFTIIKSRLDKCKTGIVFCSMTCVRTPPVNCDWCGKELRKPTVLNHNFCDRKCLGKWHTLTMSGEDSPNWKGGKIGYYGKNWGKQRYYARIRDKNTCQICGKRNKNRTMDVHHIIPFRIFGLKNYNEANKLSNLITLCHSCHMIEEANT